MIAGRKAGAACATGISMGVVYLLARIRQAALLVNLTQIVCNTSCSTEVFAGGQRRGRGVSKGAGRRGGSGAGRAAGRAAGSGAGWEQGGTRRGTGCAQRAVALKVPTAVAAIKFSRGGCVCLFHFLSPSLSLSLYVYVLGVS